VNGSDIIWVIVSPCSSHPLRLNVIRDNVAAIREFLMADSALPVLLCNFSIQQLSHFPWRAQFAKSSGVVGIFDAPHARLHTCLFPRLLATAAEARAVDGTKFIPAEFHRKLQSQAEG
jgi:hypothetical protein